MCVFVICFPKGVTMSVILDLSYTVSIWISAAVAITYTLLGGLYSVAYTDIIQLVLIFISLVSHFLEVCPFILPRPSRCRCTEPKLEPTSSLVQKNPTLEGNYHAWFLFF